MNKEQEKREISRKICEHCDDFNWYTHGCKVNRTGECPLAKDSAESILAAGYRKADEVRKEMAKRIRVFVANHTALSKDVEELLRYLDEMISEVKK